MILDIAHVQVLPPPVAGIEDVHEVVDQPDDDLAAGQRLVAEVAGPAALGVGGDDGFGDLGKRFFDVFDVAGDVPGTEMQTWLSSLPVESPDSRFKTALSTTSVVVSTTMKLRKVPATVTMPRLSLETLSRKAV